MADVTFDQLQEVFGRPMTDLGDRLEEIQKTQVKTLKNVLTQVVGQKNTDLTKYQEIITGKFNDLTTYVKELKADFTKKIEQNKLSDSNIKDTPTSQPKTDNKLRALDSVKTITLSTKVNDSIKVLPVRVVDTLDLKKVKEIDANQKNKFHAAIDIIIPPETKILIENLLSDKLKASFDDIFQREDGIQDIYYVANDIYELLKSGKFGGGKDDKKSWLDSLLPSLLPLLASPLKWLAGGAAALLGAGGIGKMLKDLFKKEGSIDTAKTPADTKGTPKTTETEETLKKIKERELALEQEKFAKKQALETENANIEEKINKLNKDLLAERQAVARAETTYNAKHTQFLKAEEAYNNALTEARQARIQAGLSALEEDNKTAKTLKEIAEARKVEMERASVELQKGYSERIKLIDERIEIEQKIKNLEAQQLKDLEARNSKTAKIRAGEIPKAELGQNWRTPIEELGYLKAQAADSASKATAKSLEHISAVATDFTTTLEKLGKILKGVGEAAGITGGVLTVYESLMSTAEHFADRPETEFSAGEQRQVGAVSMGVGAPADFVLGIPDLVAGVASGLSKAWDEDYSEDQKKNYWEAFKAGYSTNPFHENVINKIPGGSATAATRGFALDFNKLAEEDKKRAQNIGIREVGVGMLGSAGIGSIYAGSSQPMTSANIKPVEEQKLAPEAKEYMSKNTDSIDEMVKAYLAQIALIKDQINHQQKTANNTKELVEAFREWKKIPGNSSVSVATVNNTSVNTSTTSSDFRKEILKR